MRSASPSSTASQAVSAQPQLRSELGYQKQNVPRGDQRTTAFRIFCSLEGSGVFHDHCSDGPDTQSDSTAFMWYGTTYTGEDIFFCAKDSG